MEERGLSPLEYKVREACRIINENDPASKEANTYARALCKELLPTMLMSKNFTQQLQSILSEFGLTDPPEHTQSCNIM